VNWLKEKGDLIEKYIDETVAEGREEVLAAKLKVRGYVRRKWETHAVWMVGVIFAFVIGVRVGMWVS